MCLRCPPANRASRKLGCIAGWSCGIREAARIERDAPEHASREFHRLGTPPDSGLRLVAVRSRRAPMPASSARSIGEPRTRRREHARGQRHRHRVDPPVRAYFAVGSPLAATSGAARSSRAARCPAPTGSPARPANRRSLATRSERSESPRPPGRASNQNGAAGNLMNEIGAPVEPALSPAERAARRHRRRHDEPSRRRATAAAHPADGRIQRVPAVQDLPHGREVAVVDRSRGRERR